MRRRDLVIAVLDQVQMLDQEIAPARAIAEQRLDLLQGARGSTCRPFGVDFARFRPRPGCSKGWIL